MANLAVDIEKQLQKDLARFTLDPYNFVLYSYPWGMPGTILEDETGPDEFQERILKDIGHALKHGWVSNEGVKVDCTSGIYIAVSSGHGIGKSTLMAWIDDWWMTTKPYCRVVTTANTESQLKTKTWAEKAKWHRVLIHKHWFDWSATSYKHLAAPDVWRSDAIPWSEHRPQAIAGTHEKYVLVKYDEASEIPDIIWETTEGAMTDADGVKLWVVFGNPTKNTGRFRECFGKDRSRWIKYNIDSRTSKRTDKKLIEHWANLYGDDSDFFRVRVKGQFPRTGSTQFIGNDLVESAAGKIIHPNQYINRTKILGVDIARFGDDQTVIVKRQGLACFGLEKFRGLNTQTCAGYIAERIKKWKPDGIMLDMGNTGAAVYDLLNEWGFKITQVWFGSSADKPGEYFNKRVEMWGRMRDWLREGGAIPDDPELKDDLIGPEYMFSSKEQFQLERKPDMKKRGLSSPDCADALAVTFAYTVVKKVDAPYARASRQEKALTDYDVLSHHNKRRSSRQAGGRQRMAITDSGDIFNQ